MPEHIEWLSLHPKVLPVRRVMHNVHDICALIESVNDDVESLFEKNLNKIHKEIKKQSQKLKGEELAQDLAWREDEMTQFAIDFPRIHRSSLFLFSMSNTERLMKDVSDAAYKLLNLENKLKKDQNQLTIIRHVSNYLETEAGLDFRNISYYRDLLDGYWKIRNLIVHAGGNTNKSKYKNEIRCFIRGMPTLKIKNGQILFEKGFIRIVTHSIRSFFDRVEYALKKKFTSLQQAAQSSEEKAS